MDFERIDNAIVDTLQDGDVMITPEGMYEYKFLSNTTEKNFENDVERMMDDAGWHTFPSNAKAQSDYDRELALKVESLVGFV